MNENPDSTAAAESSSPVDLAANVFAAGDVEEILRERGWIVRSGDAAAEGENAAPQIAAWLESAAAFSERMPVIARR